VAWPALALACGLRRDARGRVRVPSPAQHCTRAQRMGAPPDEHRFVVLGNLACHTHLVGGREVIIDRAPILAWLRPGTRPIPTPPAATRPITTRARSCVATACTPCSWVATARTPCSAAAQGCRCCSCLRPPMSTIVHDAPCARPLLELAVRLYGRRPRLVRLDAGSWGVRLIAWIHTALGAVAVAVVPWNPKRQQNRSCLPPTWTAAALGQRTSSARFFGRVCSLFSVCRWQRPPLVGWTAVETRVALTDAATRVVGLAAQQAGRPALIRLPTRVLAHPWEGLLA